MAIGRKTGGRQKGSLNKKTLERVERERLAKLKAEAEVRKVLDSGPVREEVREALLSGRKLAIDELAEVLPVIKGMAAHYQPRPADGIERNPNANPELFEAWIRLLVDACSKLAPFQSPRFSAVVVGASTVRKITIEGGSSRRDFPELPADLAPGTVIEADENGLDPDDVDAGPSPAAA
jgi:hypothetical protein